MAYTDKEQESVRKTFAGEKAKLAQMTLSDKIQYIFTYYWIHILIIIGIIGAIAWFIHHQMTYVDYKLYGVVINSAELNEDLEQELPGLLSMDGHDGFSFIGGLSGDPDSNNTSYYNQIDLYTVSGQMDFAFTDEAGVQYLCDLGTPLDVTNELPEDLLEVWSGREAVFNQRNDNDDTYFENYAAIDISDTKVHDYFGLDDNMSYLVLVDLSGNHEYVEAFYQLLYQIEVGEIQ